MAVQKQARVQPRESDSTPETSSSSARREEARAVLDDTDALLDEIEKVLEEQAEEEQPVTLPQLIREGALLAPQAFGTWKTEAGETCALQAAYEAAKVRGLV